MVTELLIHCVFRQSSNIIFFKGNFFLNYHSNNFFFNVYSNKDIVSENFEKKIMSSQNDYYIPSTRKYNEIEPAFMSCSNGGDYIIPIAWGPISKVIGNCQEIRPGTGQCVGTFHSKDVDASDTPWSCIVQENKNVCSLTSGHNLNAKMNQINENHRYSNDVHTNNQVVARTLEELNKIDNSIDHSSQMPSSKNKNQNKNSVNQAFSNPYDGGPNPYMSYSVFSKPFLSRGKQSFFDPAGYMVGVTSYVDLRKNAEQSSILPNESWGSCSSYGNYSSSPNTTLSSESVIGESCVTGSCLQGDYTMPYKMSQKMLTQ